MTEKNSEQFGWMTTPTAASAWGKGEGLMVWLSVAFGLVGAGGYLVASFSGSFIALLISWAIVTILKNFVHFLHSRKKSAIPTMVNNMKSAWIARGTLFTALFSLLGLIQLLIMWFAPAATLLNNVFIVLTCLAAIGIIVYEVCLLASNRAIPLWQGATVPVTFTLWALSCGFTMALAFGLYGAAIKPVALTVECVLLIAVIFSLWAAFRANETAAASVAEMTKGSLAGQFWVFAIVVGIIAPLAIVCMQLAIALSAGLLFVAWICAVLGTLFYTLCFFKAAKYPPLI